jgi:hypothetical protein
MAASPSLVDAPVLRPSAEEWADPYAYIRSIQRLVAEYGIARILPPAEWSPPVVVDSSRLRLHPELQACAIPVCIAPAAATAPAPWPSAAVSSSPKALAVPQFHPCVTDDARAPLAALQRTTELAERDVARTSFLASLRDFLASMNSPLGRTPVVGGRKRATAPPPSFVFASSIWYRLAARLFPSRVPAPFNPRARRRDGPVPAVPRRVVSGGLPRGHGRQALARGGGSAQAAQGALPPPHQHTHTKLPSRRADRSAGEPPALLCSQLQRRSMATRRRDHRTCHASNTQPLHLNSHQWGLGFPCPCRKAPTLQKTKLPGCARSLPQSAPVSLVSLTSKECGSVLLSLTPPTRPHPLSTSQASHCASALRQHYSKLLLQYELVQRVRAPAPTLAEPPPPDTSAACSSCAPSTLPPGVAAAAGCGAEAGGVVCGGVSCLTLALQLQEMEERIPWDMVRDASAGCDWAVVRPIWLTAVRRRPRAPRRDHSHTHPI